MDTRTRFFAGPIAKMQHARRVPGLHQIGTGNGGAAGRTQRPDILFIRGPLPPPPEPLQVDRDKASAAMLSRLLSMTELETIRAINNAIHDDIFWAHLVYDGCEDGAARVAAMVRGTPMQPLADGFTLIDRGRKQLNNGDQRGGDLIVRGNITLLRHEQEAVVQPHLSLLSCAFARVFSLGSSLNYEPKGMVDCLRYCSSFYAFMLLREWVRLVRSRSLPRLDLLEHRWLWIERVLVPKFIALEHRAAAAKIAVIRDADQSEWLFGRTHEEQPLNERQPPGGTRLAPRIDGCNGED